MSYMSVSQSMRSNGDRHMSNACRHAANGNKEYAWGSYKKALRNWARADEMDRFFSVPPAFRQIHDQFVAAITANLYQHGTGAAGGLNQLFGLSHG